MNKRKLDAEGRNAASEGQHNKREAKNEQRGIDVANALPTLEPHLTIPAQGLESAPETMAQVEPKGSKPYEIKHHKPKKRV